MAKLKFKAPRGMRDILPKEQAYWDRLVTVIGDVSRSYGFEKIDTPILEEAELFIKGTGQDTDIVSKEMYRLTTKGRDKLALRPEFTPAIMRAYIENGMIALPQPVKLYSLGPIFRYERPQKGRYRQAHQANFEVIGEQDPVLDAQLIQLFFAIAKKLNIKNIICQLNSIGCAKCRPAYRKKLVAYFRSRRGSLCANCQKRITKNPLRVLDCKEDRCRAIAEDAPQVIDSLCDDCNKHFKSVLEYLDELDIPYILNHCLVRGLDYYTKTVFEIIPEDDESRQNALAGGGRYDGLVKLLGGQDTPSVGFAMGLERIINLIKEREIKIPQKRGPVVYLVQLGEMGKRKSLCLFEALRMANIETATSFSKNSMGSQLKQADKLGVRFSLILGQKEALDEAIIIRDMESGSQEIVPLNKVIDKLKRRLK